MQFMWNFSAHIAQFKHSLLKKQVWTGHKFASNTRSALVFAQVSLTLGAGCCPQGPVGSLRGQRENRNNGRKRPAHTQAQTSWGLWAQVLALHLRQTERHQEWSILALCLALTYVLLMCTISFNLHNSPTGQGLPSHFTDGEMKLTQKGLPKVTQWLQTPCFPPTYQQPTHIN